MSARQIEDNTAMCQEYAERVYGYEMDHKQHPRLLRAAKNREMPYGVVFASFELVFLLRFLLAYICGTTYIDFWASWVAIIVNVCLMGIVARQHIHCFHASFSKWMVAILDHLPFLIISMVTLIQSKSDCVRNIVLDSVVISVLAAVGNNISSRIGRCLKLGSAPAGWKESPVWKTIASALVPVAVFFATSFVFDDSATTKHMLNTVLGNMLPVFITCSCMILFFQFMAGTDVYLSGTEPRFLKPSETESVDIGVQQNDDICLARTLFSVPHPVEEKAATVEAETDMPTSDTWVSWLLLSAIVVGLATDMLIRSLEGLNQDNALASQRFCLMFLPISGSVGTLCAAVFTAFKQKESWSVHLVDHSCFVAVLTVKLVLIGYAAACAAIFLFSGLSHWSDFSFTFALVNVCAMFLVVWCHAIVQDHWTFWPRSSDRLYLP